MKTLIATFTLLLLASCGADKLNSKPTTGSSTNYLTNSSATCSCTSSHSPVCGDGKDYDNECIAQCFKASDIKPGHCDCSKNTTPVCGSDGQDYNECDAKNDINLTIVKYVPCAAQEI